MFRVFPNIRQEELNSEGRTHRNAWNKLEDMSQEKAMKAYVDHFIEVCWACRGGDKQGVVQLTRIHRRQLLKKAPGTESDKFIDEIEGAWAVVPGPKVRMTS